MTRAQVGSDVEILDKPEATVARPAFDDFALDRPVGTVGQQQIDDGGENEVDEHLHGELRNTNRLRRRTCSLGASA